MKELYTKPMSEITEFASVDVFTTSYTTGPGHDIVNPGFDD